MDAGSNPALNLFEITQLARVIDSIVGSNPTKP